MRAKASNQPSEILRPLIGDLIEKAGEISDPRQQAKTTYPFDEVVVVAVVAVVCGADTWKEVHQLGRNFLDWFKEYLPMENGIPSHDTYNRVFRILRPELLAGLMRDWTQLIASDSDDASPRHIALDGKCNRGSHDRCHGKRAMHIVNAYASESGLVLACSDIDEKTNEIPTVPTVLDQLDLEGAVITMDAMGCQLETAELIVDKGADYVLALKGNQGTTHQAVKALFEEIEGDECGFDDVRVRTYKKSDSGHGRKETREYFLATEIEGRPEFDKWEKFGGAVKVRSTRTIGENTTTEDRYYLTSLRKGVREVGAVIRKHWSIENKLHWRLDIAFREDESRIRKENGPANFSTLRRFAFNMLESEKTFKGSMKRKRLEAAVNPDYRRKVVFG